MKLLFWVDGKDMYGNKVPKMSVVKEWNLQFAKCDYVFLEYEGKSGQGYSKYAHKDIADIHLLAMKKRRNNIQE
jgi:hypothetical protein